MSKTFKRIVILGMITLASCIGLTTFLNVKANKLDDTTGSSETYYNMETGEYYYCCAPVSLTSN